MQVSFFSNQLYRLSRTYCLQIAREEPNDINETNKFRSHPVTLNFIATILRDRFVTKQFVKAPLKNKCGKND